MKKLKNYFKKQGFTQNGYARHLGVAEPVFSRYMNKKRKMPLELAVRIERDTKGEVECKDLV